MAKHRRVVAEAVSEMRHFLLGAALVLVLVTVVPTLAQTPPPPPPGDMGGSFMPPPPSAPAPMAPVMPPSGGSFTPPPAGGTFGAPAGGTFGAPAGGTFGAPAGGTFGAPAGGTFGAPTGGTFGAPSSSTFTIQCPDGRMVNIRLDCDQPASSTGTRPAAGTPGMFPTTGTKFPGMTDPSTGGMMPGKAGQFPGMTQMPGNDFDFGGENQGKMSPQMTGKGNQFPQMPGNTKGMPNMTQPQLGQNNKFGPATGEKGIIDPLFMPRGGKEGNFDNKFGPAVGQPKFGNESQFPGRGTTNGQFPGQGEFPGMNNVQSQGNSFGGFGPMMPPMGLPNVESGFNPFAFTKAPTAAQQKKFDVQLEQLQDDDQVAALWDKVEQDVLAIEKKSKNTRATIASITSGVSTIGTNMYNICAANEKTEECSDALNRLIAVAQTTKQQKLGKNGKSAGYVTVGPFQVTVDEDGVVDYVYKIDPKTKEPTQEAVLATRASLAAEVRLAFDALEKVIFGE